MLIEKGQHVLSIGPKPNMIPAINSGLKTVREKSCVQVIYNDNNDNNNNDSNNSW